MDANFNTVKAGDYVAVKQQLIALKTDVTAKINDPNKTTINALIDTASAKIQARL